MTFNGSLIVPMVPPAAPSPLGSGGLLVNNNTPAWIENGRITAGASSAPAELVAYINQNTTTITSAIADNGSGGSVTLVKSGLGTLTLAAANTNTGGAVVNQGTLNLSGTGTTLGHPVPWVPAA